MKQRRETVDLFCGGGGMSRGHLNAAQRHGVRVSLRAINHNPVAIQTHAINHPGVRHYLADIEAIEPRQVVQRGRLHSLVGSPECIYFSNARGAKPINDQRRSTAQYVLQWAEELLPDEVLLENVKEFQKWGPLYDDDHPDQRLRSRPIPEQSGTLFDGFVGNLRRLGYTVDWRVLCAADYGDATTRERFFLRASLHGAITWPAPTHRRDQWRAAREIIDWARHGTSIYGRRKPLVPKTMQRILAGLRKFSGLGPFLVEYHGGERFERSRGLEEPLPTQDTSNRFGLVEPYLTKLYGGHDSMSIDETLPTVTANYEHFGLVEPRLVVLRNHCDTLPIDSPLPTLCANGQHVGLMEPYLVNLKGQSTAADINAPAPTITAHARHLAMAQPYLTEYYGTGTAASIADPLDTVTTRDRFGLTVPQLVPGWPPAHLLRALADPDPLYRPQIVEIDGVHYLVEILYRMLAPSELAAAMSFPEEYIFLGTQEEQVRQIGNAVPVGLATALNLSMMQSSPAWVN